MEKYFQKLTNKGMPAVRKLIIEIPFLHKSSRKRFFFCLAFLAALFILPGQTMAVNTGTSASVKLFEAPSDFAAVAISASRIDLSWSPVPDAVFYKVYRDGLLIVSLTAAAYSDTGLAPGNPYSYTVSSVNIFGGESEQSPPVSAVFGFWAYEQTFDELAPGDLNGQDSWTQVEETINVITTETPYEGAKHISATGADYTRVIANIVSGTVYISGKVTDTTGGGQIILNSNAGGNAVTVGFRSTGNIVAYDGDTAGWTDILVGYNANTYYRIGIAFEFGAGGWEGLSADHFKVNINNGSWSSEITMENMGTHTNRIQLYRFTGANTTYWDYISPNYEPIVPPVLPPPPLPPSLPIANETGLEGGIFLPSAPGSSPSPSNSAEFQKIDTNNDGKIDMADFNTLMVNWGLTEQGNTADFNEDGVVDLFDFNLLMIYWTG